MLDKSDLEAISNLLDAKLEKQKSEIISEVTSDIKEYIKRNNVAIAEVITEAMEESRRGIDRNNLYKIIPLEG